MLPPLVWRSAVVACPQDQQLALAGRQHAGTQQEAAEGQPRPQQLLVAREAREDVVVAEPAVKARRTEFESRPQRLAPLALGQRQDARHRQLLAAGAVAPPRRGTAGPRSNKWPLTRAPGPRDCLPELRLLRSGTDGVYETGD